MLNIELCFRYVGKVKLVGQYLDTERGGSHFTVFTLAHAR